MVVNSHLYKLIKSQIKKHDFGFFYPVFVTKYPFNTFIVEIIVILDYRKFNTLYKFFLQQFAEIAYSI